MKNKIKDYTTEIPADQTIAEISKILMQSKAKGIATEFEDDGRVKSVFFRIAVGNRELNFKLPAKPDAVYRVLFQDKIGEATYGASRRIKATNIAWRIVRDWLEAQVAMIQLEQAEAAEVFFAYLMTGPDQTIFQQAKKNQFLLGTGGNDE